MKHTVKETVCLTGPLTVFQAMEFVEVAKRFHSDMTLLHHEQTICVTKLTSVVAFFLTVQTAEAVTLIATGDDAAEAVDVLKSIVGASELAAC